MSEKSISESGRSASWESLRLRAAVMGYQPTSFARVSSQRFRSFRVAQGIWIFKNMHGVFERSSVLAPIGTRFHRVPLEPMRGVRGSKKPPERRLQPVLAAPLRQESDRPG